MSALREEVKIVAPMADGLADQFLTRFVALGGVDHVQPGIERAVQQLLDRLCRRAFVADLGSAKAEHRDLHVCLAELPLFHA